MYTHSKPVPNRQHKKSTKGCKACKLRKVKCDEKHPVCNKCATYFSNIISCDWSSTTNSTVKDSKRASDSSARVLVPNKSITTGPENSSLPKLCRSFSLAPPLVERSGVIDPFGTLPGSHVSDASVHSLIHHWVKTLAMWQTSIGSQYCTNPTWLTSAISHPVLFNVTLYVTSLHMGRLRGQKETVESLFYKSETVRTLNSALRDPDRAISDETIAAILMMLHIVSLIGDPAEVEAHMNGLKQLVRMRGGIQGLVAGGVVLHMLCTTNHLTAVISDSDHLLPERGATYAKSRTCSSRSESLSATSSDYPTLKEFAVNIGFHSTMVELLDDMRYLLSVVDVFTSRFLPDYRKQFKGVASTLENYPP